MLSASGTRTASPWPPSPFIGKKPPFMQAVVIAVAGSCGQVPSLKANGAMTRSPLLDVGDLGADVLDDADELVADRAGLELGVAAVVPEVRAADAGEHDADDGVGRLAEARIGPVAGFDPAGLVEDGCTHGPTAKRDPRATWEAL